MNKIQKLDKIKKTVEYIFECKLKEKKRTKDLVFARQIFVYLAMEGAVRIGNITSYPYLLKTISQEAGYKDHSTAIYNYKQAMKWVSIEDSEFIQKLQLIKKHLEIK